MGFAVAQCQPMHRQAMVMAWIIKCTVVAQHGFSRPGARVDVMMASDLYWLDCWLRARILAAIFSRQRSGIARNSFESAGCALYGGIAD